MMQTKSPNCTKMNFLEIFLVYKYFNFMKLLNLFIKFKKKHLKSCSTLLTVTQMIQKNMIK